MHVLVRYDFGTICSYRMYGFGTICMILVPYMFWYCMYNFGTICSYHLVPYVLVPYVCIGTICIGTICSYHLVPYVATMIATYVAVWEGGLKFEDAFSMRLSPALKH